MCLGIPCRVEEIVDHERCVALVDVSGVKRKANMICVAEPGKLDDLVGSWVLLHVGFAMSVIDEIEAARTLELLEQLGEVESELAIMSESGVAQVKP